VIVHNCNLLKWSGKNAQAGGAGDQLIYVFTDNFKSYVVAIGRLGQYLIAGNVFAESNPDLDSHAIKLEEAVAAQVEEYPSIIGMSEIKRHFLAARHFETCTAVGPKRFHQLGQPYIAHAPGEKKSLDDAQSVKSRGCDCFTGSTGKSLRLVSKVTSRLGGEAEPEIHCW
jgi:hypothetical protein